MRFPQRTDTHITETLSWRLLQELAPREWIVREVSERDYGIDAYVEIASKTGDVTGNLVSIQLKGVDAIEWKPSTTPDAKTATSPQIKTSTALYWLNVPVPVFLFVADLAERNVYFATVEPFIRSHFDNIKEHETMTFKLFNGLDLRSDSGPRLFNWFVARERIHPQFVFHITTLLSSIETFGEFIIYNQDCDSFMEVEDMRHLQLRAIYDCCRTASLFLGEEWPLEPLLELYKRDFGQWGGGSFLHEATLDYVLRKLQVVFPTLVRKALKLVSEAEVHYWKATNPVFHRLCCSGAPETSLRYFEKQFGDQK
jgi:hypothetical protein